MRPKYLKLAPAFLVLALASPLSGALAQPTSQRPRVVVVGPPNSEDIESAREFVAVMYEGDTDADMGDWLTERLMDRYRRAFDLFDGVDDPALQAATADYLKSLPSRLRSIVDPRVSGLRAAAVGRLAIEWRGPEMRELLAFARTPAGKRYLQNFPVFEVAVVRTCGTLVSLMLQSIGLVLG